MDNEEEFKEEIKEEANVATLKLEEIKDDEKMHFEESKVYIKSKISNNTFL